MNQTEISGYNSIIHLKSILESFKCKNVFLVTGNNSFKSSGAEKVVSKVLNSYIVHKFFDFEINPKIEDVQRGVTLFKKDNQDIIVAIGGGSVIDMAKLISVLAVQSLGVQDFIRSNKKIIKKKVPIIAIPTTSGSGSESTHFAVIYDGYKKYSIMHECIQPDVALLDPQFCVNMPKQVAAASGMDALCQAIESYWSIHSTDESKIYSKQAIKQILGTIECAVNNPTRDTAEVMLNASHLSGKAINITKTTALHAISYPMTSYYNIPHGHAVALTLTPIFIYNSNVSSQDVIDARGVEYVKSVIKELSTLMDITGVSDIKIKIKKMMCNIGLSTKLTELGIRSNYDIEKIAKNINTQRLKNNPRIITKKKIKTLLLDIM